MSDNWSWVIFNHLKCSNYKNVKYTLLNPEHFYTPKQKKTTTKTSIFAFSYCPYIFPFHLWLFITMHSLKINEFIQSFQTGVHFFSTQLLLKVLVFELNVFNVIELELYIYNWESRFYSSNMIFWWVTKLLHRLSINLPLYQLLVWNRGRMVNAFCLSFSTEDRSAGSITVLQLWAFWTWMPGAQILPK